MTVIYSPGVATYINCVICFFVTVVVLLKVERCIAWEYGRRLNNRCKNALNSINKAWHFTEATDILQGFCAAFLCAVYVHDTYHGPEKGLELSGKICTIFFIFDYLFRGFLAKNRMTYILSVFGIVDVITIMPDLILWAGFAGDSKSTPNVLRAIRCSKMFRLMRSFNVLHNFTTVGILREALNLAFIVFLMVFISAAIFQVLDSNYEDEQYTVKFHEALYYSTISVLGRPRIPALTMSGHLFFIVLVSLAVILIPRQLARLWVVIQAEPFNKMCIYKKTYEAHIVIVGTIDAAVLNLLLFEAYAPERVNCRPFDVVILNDAKPSIDIQRLIANVAYVDHVQYLEGSPLVENDLRRACLDSAQAVLVVANKYPQDPNWEDMQLSAIVIACKCFEHAQKNDGNHPVRVIAQVAFQSTRERIQQIPGWRPSHDLCLAVDELTAGMLTLAAAYRGMATFLLNLISCSAVSLRSQRSKEKVRAQSPIADWFAEYHLGSSQDTFTCRVPSESKLIGESFLRTAQILYCNHGMLLLALTKSDMTVPCLFPGTGIKVEHRDRLFVIARSISELVAVVKSQCEHVIDASSLTSELIKAKFVRSKSGGHMTFEEEKKDNMGNSNVFKQVQNMISQPKVRGAFQDVASSALQITCRTESVLSPANTAAEVTLSSLTLCDHFLLYGGDLPVLQLTTRMLLQRTPTAHVVIVGHSENEVKGKAEWEELPEGQFHLIPGELSFHDVETLASIQKARAVIVLPTATYRNFWANKSAEYRRIIDSDTILTTNVLINSLKTDPSSAHTDVWTVMQLVQEGTLTTFFGIDFKFDKRCQLDARWEADPPVNMSPMYAAGHVVSASVLDRFLIESLFNPDMLPLIRQLMHLPKKSQQSQESGSCLHQLSLSQSVLDEISTFGQLCRVLLNCKNPTLPLGLFRCPEGHSCYSSIALRQSTAVNLQETCTPQNEAYQLPYVFTNPPPDTQLRSSDLVFVLGMQPGEPATGDCQMPEDLTSDQQQASDPQQASDKEKKLML